MKSLTKQATAIFQELIQPLQAQRSHRKIDRGGAGIMPVVVERIGQWPQGWVYSVAHYWEKNGDLMADPDMTFLVCQHGDVFPLTYQQDGLGLYQEAATCDGGQLRYNVRLQRDLASFASDWMKNIKDQQRDLSYAADEAAAEAAQ